MKTEIKILDKIKSLKNELEEIHNNTKMSFEDPDSWSRQQTYLKGKIYSLEWVLKG